MQNMYDEIKRLFTSISVTLIRKQIFFKNKKQWMCVPEHFSFFLTEVLFTPSGERKEDPHTRHQQWKQRRQLIWVCSSKGKLWERPYFLFSVRFLMVSSGCRGREIQCDLHWGEKRQTSSLCYKSLIITLVGNTWAEIKSLFSHFSPINLTYCSHNRLN